jgi:hypothetical protein
MACLARNAFCCPPRYGDNMCLLICTQGSSRLWVKIQHGQKDTRTIHDETAIPHSKRYNTQNSDPWDSSANLMDEVARKVCRKLAGTR